MQAVPSLVGTGTAVAAAATGLVFGQLGDEHQSSLRPASSKRKSLHEFDFSSTFTASSRPATRQSVAPPPLTDRLRESTIPPRGPHRPSSQAQYTPPKSSTLRPASTRPAEVAPIVENTRDSISSNGSWMRKLSIRPLSQHESIRSSIGPGSPSIAFSHGSSAPILSPTGAFSPQLPPNKLVKRASASNSANGGPVARRGSKSQMTLRRPATSHQRSATLQRQLEADEIPPIPKFSFDRQPRVRANTTGMPEHHLSDAPSSDTAWKSFWHAKVSKLRFKYSPLRSSDGGPSRSAKRICPEQESRPTPYLLTPETIMPGRLRPETPLELGYLSDNENENENDQSPQDSEKSRPSSRATPSKTPRRSVSLHFSSPSTWISKTGSIRRRKRGDTVCGDGHNEGNRLASVPLTAPAVATLSHPPASSSETRADSKASNAESELAAMFRPPNRNRHNTSPSPPTSGLTGLHPDVNQANTPPRSQPSPENQSVLPQATARISSNTSQGRTLERASTVASSEYHRGFTSGDDDDTDVKTDTPFDSFRTMASNRKRAMDSPLDSMFDDSPPSTAGNNSKPKRLSIQEILGPNFDVQSKITEEDETLQTPVRTGYEDAEACFRVAGIEDDDDLKFASLLPEVSLTRDSRVSFEDDDDLDWARDDESQIFNQLSPPSSMNSRRGSPSLRMALANISGNAAFDPQHDMLTERPRSNIFDWVEPPHHEKNEPDGHGVRPRTVHGKKELDMRGGRASNRKGPAVAHVRSQSVPVVPEANEPPKSAPKFGTWGLGTKNVSEDWDDDFDFEEPDPGQPTGTKEDSSFPMVVPASIQATQPTVKAHSGQIRELSLLVNDLKRLCRLGREMDMLKGPTEKLWREAEGVIALASPDEDDPAATEPNEIPSSKIDSVSSDGCYFAQGFDGASLDEVELGAKTNSRAQPGHRALGRRQSVFSPEDDIFGTWERTEDSAMNRPKTPENRVDAKGYPSNSATRSVMAAMQSREANFGSNAKLNFDTNSLKELVKQASDLRDSLSDLVRRADRITQSPARTPKRTRHDGSPAFTRVFDEPSSSPTKRMPQSHSNSSVLSGGDSIGESPNNGLGQRFHMMTVS